ncbi:MAG: transposase, partial [Candidatus Hatepunaea meridiana]|nr:transposase [Candidatus Hatepunaea meridiana]
AHYTFEGNTSDRSTVIEVIDDIKKRFRVDSVILVADKGMTSRINYGWLEKEGIPFILGESKRIRRDARDSTINKNKALSARFSAC